MLSAIFLNSRVPEMRQVSVKVKVQVYSLVSSAKRHSPDFTQ